MRYPGYFPQHLFQIAPLQFELAQNGKALFASTLFFMLLPRLPGVLEKGWAPAVDQADPGTWEAYRSALAQQAPEWERRNLPYFLAASVWSEE